MNSVTVSVLVDKLKPGMRLAEDLHNDDGFLIIASGTVLNAFIITRIKENANIGTVLIQMPKEEGLSFARRSEAGTSSPMSKIAEDYRSYAEQREEVHDAAKAIKVKMLKNATYKIVKKNLQKLREDKNPSIDILLNVVEEILEEILSSEDILIELDKTRGADDYFYDHAVNTAVIAIAVGIAMSLGRTELVSLGKGAFFCDVGKMQIDSYIVNKPGDLTSEEYAEMKRCPEYGYSYLKNHPAFDENALKAILECRERYDGKGYPKGLKGDEISIYGQIVGFSSFFDAVTSKRTYKSAITYYDAMSMALRMVGTYFDKKLVLKAVQILGLYNVGMDVRLKSGEVAKVIEVGRHKPVLRVMYDPNVKKAKQSYEIDIKKNPAVKIQEVVLFDSNEND